MTFSVRGRTVKEVRAWHLPCRQFRLGVGGRRLGAGIVGIEAIYIVYSVHFFGLLPPEAASVCSIRFAGGGAGEVGFPAGIETIQECPYDLPYPYRVIIKKVAIQSK